jgi:8-oxo-dGTP pyrophosphatase MutT (NUDIX family)
LPKSLSAIDVRKTREYLMPDDVATSDGGPRYPVSVKGVLLLGSRVPLLLNERDEWELPGGRLETGEQPQACVAREIMEELGLPARAEHLLDAWVYEVLPGKKVLILTYGCVFLGGSTETIQVSAEHRDARLFEIHEIGSLRIPEGYRRPVSAWLSRTAPSASRRR